MNRNRKALSLTLALIMFALLLASCASNTATGQSEDIFSKRNIGGVLGAVGGGVAGSKFGSGSGKTATTIIGALAGAALGGYLGNAMDENDRHRANNALETTRDNQHVSWRNPNTNAQYTMTPTRTYEPEAGRPCRDYTTRAIIDGQEEVVHGTACRDSSGVWRQQG